jgi:hypothetical protein
MRIEDRFNSLYRNLVCGNRMKAVRLVCGCYKKKVRIFLQRFEHVNIYIIV